MVDQSEVLQKLSGEKRLQQALMLSEFVLKLNKLGKREKSRKRKRR